MKPVKMDSDYRMGRLPSAAPLANPYVPYQMEHSAQYDARKGLIRGTMFQALDLPFMGKVNNKLHPVTAMTEMQALDFAIQDLALYLDTHREDHEALEMYYRYQQLYKKACENYEKMHGPIDHADDRSSKNYEWLHDPWPWEYAKNKED